ncbi:MAG: hypothetical protein JNM86_15030 [Phycisphaerae bacterium]|nr:hypothetical protein [Phycisphaerae bacterium]
MKPLPGTPDCVAHAVSGDGRVVVGYSGQFNAPRTLPQQPTLWRTPETAEPLGIPSSSTDAVAVDANIDGSIVLVSGVSRVGPPDFRTYLWTETLGYEWLGESLSGIGNAIAQAVSSDGTTVVGAGDSGSGNLARGFRWNRAWGMTSSLLLDSVSTSQYYGLSRDGRVAVGGGNRNMSSSNTAIAATIDKIIDLGTFPGESYAVALDANEDGSVVVGYGRKAGGMRGFRWTEETGLVDLGTPRSGLWLAQDYSSIFVHAANADGSVVVGEAWGPMGSRAFAWTPSLGMIDLNSYFSAMGIPRSDGALTAAISVSDDGRIIAGVCVGEPTRGFIASFPRYCPGDMNFDGAVDDADFQVFIWNLNLGGDPLWNEDGNRADLNFDSIVTSDDIEIFRASYDRLVCEE